jgi:hypothetical protein
MTLHPTALFHGASIAFDDMNAEHGRCDFVPE